MSKNTRKRSSTERAQRRARDEAEYVAELESIAVELMRATGAASIAEAILTIKRWALVDLHLRIAAISAREQLMPRSARRDTP